MTRLYLCARDSDPSEPYTRATCSLEWILLIPILDPSDPYTHSHLIFLLFLICTHMVAGPPRVSLGVDLHIRISRLYVLDAFVHHLRLDAVVHHVWMPLFIIY